MVRNSVERFLRRLKGFRRLGMRHERLATTFLWLGSYCLPRYQLESFAMSSESTVMKEKIPEAPSPIVRKSTKYWRTLRPHM
jgi:hypothetical protein